MTFLQSTEAVTGGVLLKKVFLKISQILKVHTYTTVSVLTKLQGWGLQLYLRDSGKGAFL